MTNCYYCGSEMQWISDYDYEEYGKCGEGIVTVLSCSNEECGVIAEFYKEIKGE